MSDISNYELWETFKNDDSIIEGLIKNNELTREEVETYAKLSNDINVNCTDTNNIKPNDTTTYLDIVRQTKKIKDARYLFSVFKRRSNEPQTREELYNAMLEIGFEYKSSVRSWCYNPK